MNLNLDAMSEEELLKLAFDFWNHPIISARKTGLKVCDIRLLSHYASNKSAAFYCRKEGDITSALNYERICENLYNRLSDEAKW